MGQSNSQNKLQEALCLNIQLHKHPVWAPLNPHPLRVLYTSMSCTYSSFGQLYFHAGRLNSGYRSAGAC